MSMSRVSEMLLEGRQPLSLARIIFEEIKGPGDLSVNIREACAALMSLAPAPRSRDFARNFGYRSAPLGQIIRSLCDFSDTADKEKPDSMQQ
jgi:hypothetical protein